MGLGSFIWYGGATGVAVLYSVVVGAVREFWVKTKKYDVKVGEIPTEEEIPWEPYDLPNGTTTYIPGSGANVFWTWSWGALGNPSSTSTIDVYGRTFIHYVFNIIESCTSLGSEPFTSITGNTPMTLLSGVYNFYNNSGTRPGPIETEIVNKTRFVGPPLEGEGEFAGKLTGDCGPDNFFDTFIRYRAIGVDGGITGPSTQLLFQTQNIFIIHPSTDPNSIFRRYSTDSIRVTQGFVVRDYDYQVTLNSSFSTPGGPVTPPSWPTDDPPPTPPDPIIEPVPYECFVSASLGKTIFILIKSDVDDSGQEFGILKYQSLVGDELDDLGDTPSLEDWRGDAVSLVPTESVPVSTVCLDDYLPNSEVLLDADILYTIDLDQTISGQTLRTRLETSPDTVTATLTTQTATSGETCTLGTATTSTVQVPSPGRGTIEGITYLP
jgi:hypothetical protein